MNHIVDANKKVDHPEQHLEMVLKAAQQAGGESENGMWLLHQRELERFWAAAYRAGMERAAEICDSRAQMLAYPSSGNFVAIGLASAIRSHAQNQPKNVHDTAVMYKN